MKWNYLCLFFSTIVLIQACQRDPYREGALLYKMQCANCHGDEGQGLGELIPPLAKSDYLTPHRAELPCLLIKGQNDTIIVNGKKYFDQAMPANEALSDVQVSNILNYVQNNWGNEQPDFTLDEVRKALTGCR
jgi:mono/diheme cytochrome c family protein